MPQELSTVAEALTSIMRIIGLSEESLRKLLIRGEFDEYPDSKSVHCTAHFAEMLNKFSQDSKTSFQNDSCENFLVDEISVLEETKSVALQNFLPDLRSSQFYTIRSKQCQKYLLTLLLKCGTTLSN